MSQKFHADVPQQKTIRIPSNGLGNRDSCTERYSQNVTKRKPTPLHLVSSGRHPGILRDSEVLEHEHQNKPIVVGLVVYMIFSISKPMPNE